MGNTWFPNWICVFNTLVTGRSFPSAHNTRLFIGLNSGIFCIDHQEFCETKDVDVPLSTNMSTLTFPHTPDTHIPWAPDLDTPRITAAVLGNSPRLEFWFSANSRPIEPASCCFPTGDAVAQRGNPDTKFLAENMLPWDSDAENDLALRIISISALVTAVVRAADVGPVT